MLCYNYFEIIFDNIKCRKGKNMKKGIIIGGVVVAIGLIVAVVAVLFLGVKIGDFEISPVVHVTIGNEPVVDNKNDKVESANNKSEKVDSNTDKIEDKNTTTTKTVINTSNTNKRKSYKYVFSTNGSAVLKQTTSDSPTTWYSAICSNCGKKSKMYVNSNASFNFTGDEVTDTYKKKVICDNCKKPYDIEITCQRIEK